MFQVQLTYTSSGKKYTFSLNEVAKDVLTESQLAKIKKIILKEIQQL